MTKIINIPKNINGGSSHSISIDNEIKHKIKNRLLKFKIINEYSNDSNVFFCKKHILNLFQNILLEELYDDYLIDFNYKFLNLYIDRNISNNSLKYHICRIIHEYNLDENIKNALLFFDTNNKNKKINVDIINKYINIIIKKIKNELITYELEEEFNELINQKQVLNDINDKILYMFNIEHILINYLTILEKKFNILSNNIYHIYKILN